MAELEELQAGYRGRQCFAEVGRAVHTLRAEGFEPPNFIALAEGAKPEQPTQDEVDPGEWRHGWQYFAAKTREEFYLEHTALPSCTRTEQALFRSQAGRNCARALTALPSDPTVASSAARFNVTLCRRLRLPLFCTASHCEGCGQRLDPYGDHLAACMRIGRVQSRAKPPERAWAHVFREAGTTVHEQHLLRNSTLPVDPTDNRRIDVLVTGWCSC